MFWGYEFVCELFHLYLSGGNQREKSREKAAKKQKEADKKKGAGQKDGNRGLTLEERRHRYEECSICIAYCPLARYFRGAR